jgi:hypothetical protein
MPIASARQFMLFAVNMPEQLPQVGHAAFSISSSSSALIWPLCRFAPAMKASIRSIGLPSWVFPASIGPPETKTVGMLARMAPMNIPGTILSQLGMQIMPSKRWASIMVSTESAMISREGSENFIPRCPMAIPSSTPIVLNRNGTPPASRTHSLTKLPTS